MADNGSKCEQCRHYGYDEDCETYVCDVDLDEDEMAKFMTDTFKDCPYYDPDGEYKIVRSQM
ncbi:MAG: hypothetical protein J5950_03705 [Clostridia bacterium]|nr:hypothetical protein [Clostridia bacterium]